MRRTSAASSPASRWRNWPTRTRKTPRGAGQVKRRLIESGQLVVLEEGGGRGRSAVYWLKLPGLPGPEKPRDEEPGKDAQTLNDPGGQTDGGSNTGTTTTSFVFSRARPELRRGAARRRRPRRRCAPTPRRSFTRSARVGGKQVTPAEMAIAAAALAAYNREFRMGRPEGRRNRARLGDDLDRDADP